MKEYDFDSLKYWKESAALSGTIAFIWLVEYIALLMFREAISYISVIEELVRGFLMDSEICLVFFVLFIISGILAVRGSRIGVFVGLILSVIIVLMVMVVAISLSRSFTHLLLNFVALLPFSPQALLSIFNIYYLVRATRTEIYGTIMSLYRFLACSIQYSIATFMGIVGVISLIYSLPYPIMLVPSLMLIILFITLYYSAHHMFKNDEENISKKRVYILTGIALLILITLLLLVSFPGITASQEAFVRALIIFAEALIIPFIIASLGFVVAIPKQRYLSRPSAISHEKFEERYSIPRQEESYNTGFIEKMYCRYCGRSIPSDSLYCQYCGRRLR